MKLGLILYKEFIKSSLGKKMKFVKQREISSVFPATMYVQYGIIIDNKPHMGAVDDESSYLEWDKGVKLPDGGSVYSIRDEANDCYITDCGDKCIRIHRERPQSSCFVCGSPYEREFEMEDGSKCCRDCHESYCYSFVGEILAEIVEASCSYKENMKRPRSAYIYFCLDKRESVSREFPNLRSKDVTRKLGERWQILKKTGGEEMEEYERLWREDQTRYKINKISK